jgi:hypothetical protein
MDQTLFAASSKARLGTTDKTRLFLPVSLLVLLVHESVLHTSESNRNHSTEKKKDGRLVERRVKDFLLHLKKIQKNKG